MSKRTSVEIIEEVKEVLEKEGELSIRQVALKTGSQWRTAERILKQMKALGIVRESKGENKKMNERLFSLSKK